MTKSVKISVSSPVQNCSGSACGGRYDTSHLGMAPCPPTEIEENMISNRSRRFLKHSLKSELASYRCVVDICRPYTREE